MGKETETKKWGRNGNKTETKQGKTQKINKQGKKQKLNQQWKKRK